MIVAIVPTSKMSSGSGLGIRCFPHVLRGEEDLLVALESCRQRRSRLLAADDQRHHHVREHHQVPEWKEGELAVLDPRGSRLAILEEHGRLLL
jgi:hypothetical protein